MDRLDQMKLKPGLGAFTKKSQGMDQDSWNLGRAGHL